MSSFQLPRKILVGAALGGTSHHNVAATDQDRRILERSLRIADLIGAEVRLLHIGEWAEAPGGLEIESELIAEREAVLQSFIDETRKNTGFTEVKVSYGISVGRPWVCLLDEAQKWDAGLIVIGPVVHRPGIVTRLIHGSTAGRLIRQSPVPVLKVSGELISDTMRNLLVPVDFSPMSADLVAAANAIHERRPEVRRYLLHCLRFPQDIVMHRTPDPREALREYHAQVEAEARSKINALLGDQRDGWEVIIERDWIGRVAPEVVLEYRIDLMIIAGVSLPRIAGLLLGTTAEKILESTDVSAYIIRPHDVS